MLLRRACLDEVGVFDERFFSYCEEADLGLRARRRGWKVGLVRGAMVKNLHLGSSVPMVDYLQTRNTLLLVQEMSGWYHALVRAVHHAGPDVEGRACARVAATGLRLPGLACSACATSCCAGSVRHRHRGDLSAALTRVDVQIGSASPIREVPIGPGTRDSTLVTVRIARATDSAPGHFLCG